MILQKISLYKKTRINQKQRKSIQEYRFLNQIGCGVYGHIYSAQHIKTGHIVAIKCIKPEDNNTFELSSSIIRQLSLHKKIKHQNVVQLLDYIVDLSSQFTYFVLEAMPMDLEKRIIISEMNIQEIRCIIFQILKGIQFCHRNGIAHRDIKPSNILINPETKITKICDFGLAKQIQINGKNTTNVSALFYMAPQLLFKDSYYTFPIDIWAIGCIFGKCLIKKNLFQGDIANEINQIYRIKTVLGIDKTIDNLKQFFYSKTPIKQLPVQNSIKQLQTVCESALDLLNKMIAFNPSKRITAKQALKHPFFDKYNKNELFKIQKKEG